MGKNRAQVVDGNKIAERIKDEVCQEVLALNKNKFQNAEIRPNLAIILVGDNQESDLYVSKKLEEAKKVGIDTHLYKFSEIDDQNDIIKTIEILNKDQIIDAILVQLPLPLKFETNKIIETIDPKKDVDCFHPVNQKRKIDRIISPVHGAVLEILAEAKYEIFGKKVLIISNSEVFSKKLKIILEKKGAQVKGIVFRSLDLKKEIAEADLIISAIGRPFFIKEEMLKDGAGIIDVGISREGKKIKGDFDSGKIENKISFFTPVPGGVGPITVALLLKNTLELAKNRLNF